MDAPIFLRCWTNNSLRNWLVDNWHLLFRLHIYWHVLQKKKGRDLWRNGQTIDEVQYHVELRSFNKTIILPTVLEATGQAPGRLRLHWRVPSSRFHWRRGQVGEGGPTQAVVGDILGQQVHRHIPAERRAQWPSSGHRYRSPRAALLPALLHNPNPTIDYRKPSISCYFK